MDVRKLATAEVNAINRTFTEFGIVARVAPQQGTLIANSSHIAHRLQRGDGVRIDAIAKRLPEIRQALARVRGQDELPVRLQWPLLETPHPSPVPLRLPTLQAKPHEMLIGRAYTSRHEVKDERITFDDSPHVLIAGITNAGKSVLAQTMLLSLVANTSPADLQLVIVDLKNEDMTPFAGLPHVARFARRPAEALDAIRMVQAEKEKRIDKPNRKPFRLVLWIDEVAQLANDKDAIEMLGDIASIGRSKAINLVVATQHPTASGGIGGLMKANFPLRLVGMVAPGTAHIATNRPNTGAEQLPGKGAFLYLQSNDVHRFQSFYVSADDVYRYAQQVERRWTGTQKIAIKQPEREIVYQSTMPVWETGLDNDAENGADYAQNEDADNQTSSSNQHQTSSGGFAIPYAMPDEPRVKLTIRRIYKLCGSKNRTIEMLWPGRNKVKSLQYLNAAIEERIAA
jgi:hypothetical protein